MDRVSASQPLDGEFEPHMGNDHNASFDISTGWVLESDSRLI